MEANAAAPPPVMEGINAEVPPPKTIFVIAHGKYIVNNRHHIQTCILSADPARVESVVTVAGFPGTVIRSYTISIVCTYINTIRDRSTADLQRAFPPIAVTNDGVPSPLYRDGVTGRYDNGNSLIGLYKGKDVFIQVTDPAVADHPPLEQRMWGKHLQNLLSWRPLPATVEEDRDLLPGQRILTTFTISAYRPSRRAAPAPETTRTLKLQLFQVQAGLPDPYRPWVGMWDGDTFDYDRATFYPTVGRLGDIPLPNPFNANDFGSIDQVLANVAGLNLGGDRPVRVIFFVVEYSWARQ